jgi:putative Holliday junction resolvase
VLAVDHGEKRIGLAISDQTGTVARALQIIHHVSRLTDARRVLELAARNQADLIVIGYSTDEDGKPNLAGRRSSRFATALKAMTAMPVVLWDESLSTQDAERARIASGASRKRRARPADALAAAVILQSYLDEATGLGEKIEGT